MIISDHINSILKNNITRGKIHRVSTRDGISPREPEGAGAPDHRHLPGGGEQRVPASDADRATVVLARGDEEVHVERNGQVLEVGRGGRALGPGDLGRSDVRIGRDAVVEDHDLAEDRGGGVGDGGVRDPEQRGVGARARVVDVEVELCEVFVAFGDGFDPRAAAGGGCGGEEEEEGGGG